MQSIVMLSWYFMLSVTYKPFILCVIILNVVMLSVMVPLAHACCTAFTMPSGHTPSALCIHKIVYIIYDMISSSVVCFLPLRWCDPGP
jgi:hypothetical protein